MKQTSLLIIATLQRVWTQAQAEGLNTWVASMVPSQQSLCSAAEEIFKDFLRDSASGIEVVDTWSGWLAISPLVVQEDTLQP